MDIGRLSAGRRLGLASLIVSFIGVVISVVIVGVVLGVMLSVNQSSTSTTNSVRVNHGNSAESFMTTTTPSICNGFRVYDMCFANQKLAVVDSCGDSDVCYGSCRYCCHSEAFFYQYYCYSELVMEKSTSCPYKALGECFTNRYYHGPCTYDACCSSGRERINETTFLESWCYYRTQGQKTGLNTSCTYSVSGKCYDGRSAWEWGPCTYSRCCELDETYYNHYCYFNGTSGKRTPAASDPAWYTINSVEYRGRYFTGGRRTDGGRCTFSWDLYYNGHCYYP